MLNKSETLLAGNKLVCNIPDLIRFCKRRTHTPSHPHPLSQALPLTDMHARSLWRRQETRDTGIPWHHHTYYVTSSYILCHIIIHAMSHHHSYYVTSSFILDYKRLEILCHIIIHTMSHHHSYYVTSSFILDYKRLDMHERDGACWQPRLLTFLCSYDRMCSLIIECVLLL